MGVTEVGEVTTGSAVMFEKGDKSFVRFTGPGCGVAEVFGSKEFAAEFGMTFAEFCEKMNKEDDERAEKGV